MGKESIYKVKCPGCGNEQQVLVRGTNLKGYRQCAYCPAKIKIQDNIINKVK